MPLRTVYQAVKSTTVSNRFHYYSTSPLCAHSHCPHQYVEKTIDKVATWIWVSDLCCWVPGQDLGFVWPNPYTETQQCFNRLFSQHYWLQNFCTATDQGYVNHFDTFWEKPHLLRSNGVHTNRALNQRTEKLIFNLTNYITLNPPPDSDWLVPCHSEAACQWNLSVFPSSPCPSSTRPLALPFPISVRVR